MIRMMRGGNPKKLIRPTEAMKDRGGFPGKWGGREGSEILTKKIPH